ncbi:hypothetical protein KEM56_004405, partial [Ascosphaera pollenicola]
YFESGAAAIRRHLKALHRIEVERAIPGTGQQSQKLEMQAFYADMYRYHKEFEDYDTNGGEKPTFNTIGPEESRFPRKGCTEASEDGRLEAIGRRVHKRKRAAADEAPDETSSEEHGERERKRVSSRAERSVTGDDEEQSSDSWDPDVYVWPPRPRDEEDGPEFGGSTTRIYINGKRRRLGEGLVYVTNMPKGGLPVPPCDLTEEQWKAFGVRTVHG